MSFNFNLVNLELENLNFVLQSHSKNNHQDSESHQHAKSFFSNHYFSELPLGNITREKKYGSC